MARRDFEDRRSSPSRVDWVAIHGCIALLTDMGISAEVAKDLAAEIYGMGVDYGFDLAFNLFVLSSSKDAESGFIKSR